jgi:hypothetical protein
MVFKFFFFFAPIGSLYWDNQPWEYFEKQTTCIYQLGRFSPYPKIDFNSFLFPPKKLSQPNSNFPHNDEMYFPGETSLLLPHAPFSPAPYFPSALPMKMVSNPYSFFSHDHLFVNGMQSIVSPIQPPGNSRASTAFGFDKEFAPYLRSQNGLNQPFNFNNRTQNKQHFGEQQSENSEV